MSCLGVTHIGYPLRENLPVDLVAYPAGPAVITILIVGYCLHIIQFPIWEHPLSKQIKQHHLQIVIFPEEGFHGHLFQAILNILAKTTEELYISRVGYNTLAMQVVITIIETIDREPASAIILAHHHIKCQPVFIIVMRSSILIIYQILRLVPSL